MKTDDPLYAETVVWVKKAVPIALRSGHISPEAAEWATQRIEQLAPRLAVEDVDTVRRVGLRLSELYDQRDRKVSITNQAQDALTKVKTVLMIADPRGDNLRRLHEALLQDPNAKIVE